MLLTDKNYAVIIPARLQSTRLPGKPLVKIAGKELVLRTWLQCVKAVGREHVYIATDSEKIADLCSSQSANVVMTSGDHLTGTDRVFEAATKLGLDFVINVQGDEPLINPQDIVKVMNHATNSQADVVNAMCPIPDEHEFNSVNIPKVVTSPNGKLLYMSRAAIPGNKQKTCTGAMKQVCIYVFSIEALSAFANCKQKTPLEEIEDIEILRFLELGIDVEMVELAAGTIAVDVAEDVEKVEQVIREQGL